jgi:O-antigen/teichoic acid export membrane protein
MSKEATGKNTLTFRAALLAAAKIVGFAITIPLPLVLVRTPTQHDFGLYKQVFQILGDALTLLGLHVSVSAYYFMPRHPEKKAQVALNVLVFYGAVGSVVALLFAIYPRWITLIFKSDELVPYVPLIGFAILLWLLSSLLEVVAVANTDIGAAAFFTVLVQLSKSAMLMAAGTMFQTIEAIVWAAVVQGFLQCLLLFAYLHKKFGKFWRSFDRALFKTQLSNAIPFGLGALAYATQANLHNYFIAHYFDPAVFAIYAVGCFELPLLGLLLDAVISVLLPEVARREGEGDTEGIIALWASAIRKLAFFFIPAYTLLFVLRHEFITFLFTREYEASVPIFTVNLLGILLYITVPTSIIRAFDELKFFRLKLSLAMLPVSFAVLYFAVHSWGLIGVVSGYVFLLTLDLFIILARIGRRLGIAPRDLRRLAPVLRSVAAASVAAIVTVIVKIVLPHGHPFVTLAVCGSIFVIVHLAMAFAFGAVMAEEKQQLRELLARFYRFGSSLVRLSATR